MKGYIRHCYSSVLLREDKSQKLARGEITLDPHSICLIFFPNLIYSTRPRTSCGSAGPGGGRIRSARPSREQAAVALIPRKLWRPVLQLLLFFAFSSLLAPSYKLRRPRTSTMRSKVFAPACKLWRLRSSSARYPSSSRRRPRRSSAWSDLLAPACKFRQPHPLPPRCPDGRVLLPCPSAAGRQLRPLLAAVGSNGRAPSGVLPTATQTRHAFHASARRRRCRRAKGSGR